MYVAIYEYMYVFIPLRSKGMLDRWRKVMMKEKPLQTPFILLFLANESSCMLECIEIPPQP